MKLKAQSSKLKGSFNHQAPTRPLTGGRACSRAVADGELVPDALNLELPLSFEL
jgi:hypothetical protein